MAETSNTQRKFDLLYASLCEIQSSLIDSATKVAGFLLRVTGWIATSDTARGFLHSDKSARHLTVTALGGAFALYVAVAVGAFSASKETLGLLDKMDFMPSDHYKRRSVDIPMLFIVLAGLFFLAAMAVGLILRTR